LALPCIPPDLISDWLAGLVVRGIADVVDAHQMALDAAYCLAKGVYRFSEP
jgi:hypothetical protein